MRRILLTLLALVALAAPAAAQTGIVNPSALTFTSPDHALISAYEVDVVTAAGVVLSTIVTGRGTQAASGDVTIPLNLQPIAFGVYTFRVRAVAVTVRSKDSPTSDAWTRAPGAPSKPIAQ